MDPIRFSINNPVKILVGVMLTVLFGLVAYSNIPVQLTPDVERPIVTIHTNWQGRSPQEIENSIIQRQEEKLSTIQGLDKMYSMSSLGRASVTLEFNIGYDIKRALQEVSSKLDEVRNMPPDADRPTIKASSSASEDAVSYVMIGSVADNKEAKEFDVATFFDHADRYLKPTFQRIPGVAEVGMYGGREHEFHLQIDPVRLARMNITPEELLRAVKADNLDESAGDLAGGRLDMRFRVTGRYDNKQQVLDTIVKVDEHGVPIKVSDLGDAVLTLEKRKHFDQSEGRSIMNLFIKREVGANVLDITKEVNKRIAELNKPGSILRAYEKDRYQLRLKLLVDNTFYIERSLDIVRLNLTIGGLLAIVVLLLFLRSFRPTLICAAAIPISVLGTLVVMSVTGRSMNVISLAGLSFAVGIVVDNAIVVLENIDRHMSMHEAPLVAAYRGTKEVWGAVLSSTLTTVAVFGPVLTIQEEAGQLYYDIALAICASVLISLLVSVTVIPMLASRLLKERQPLWEQSKVSQGFHTLGGVTKLLDKGVSLFSRCIYFLTLRSFSGVYIRTLILVVTLVSTFFLIQFLMLPASYLPEAKKSVAIGRLTSPPGYSMEKSEEIGRDFEKRIKKFRYPGPDVPKEKYHEYCLTKEEATAYARKIGMVDVNPDTGEEKPVEDIYPIDRAFFVVIQGRFFLTIGTSRNKENAESVIKIFEYSADQMPGFKGSIEAPSIFGRRAGSAVILEVVSNNIASLVSSAAAIEAKIRPKFPPRKVRINPPDYNQAGPETRIRVNQKRAKELKVTGEDIAIACRMLVDGRYAGDFDYEGDSIDLLIKRHPKSQMSIDELLDVPISVQDSDGKYVSLPLSELVIVEKADAQQSIQRIEQQKAIAFIVNFPKELALEEAQQLIEDAIQEARDEGLISSDVFMRMAGSADKLSETLNALVGDWKGGITVPKSKNDAGEIVGGGINWEKIRGIATSRFIIALVITYLLMAALFESFLYPLVIMLSVPMAMVGGFAGLWITRLFNPAQQMDTMTMLGFVILVGVVVNNAILVVHQALNFMRGIGEGSEDMMDLDPSKGLIKMEPREAIAASVRTRVRPVLMTTATSVIGMAPLVIATGAGSEIYRGIGSVVVGGLLLGSFFSLLVVPLMFSLMLDAKAFFLKHEEEEGHEKIGSL